MAVVVMAVAGVSIVFPLRDHLARGELRWMQRQWAASFADDSARIAAEHHLNAYLPPVADGAEVHRALAAVYRDQQHRFQFLHDRLHRAVLVDPSLAHLRTRMDAALTHRAGLLARVAAWFGQPSQSSPRPDSADNQTAADTIEVEHSLKAERAHWGEHQPVPTAAAAPYAAATAALAHLTHWLDQPTGAALIAGSGDSLVRLDVDASKAAPTGIPPGEGFPTPRAAYLAYSSGGHVWAIGPDGSGSPRALAIGDSLFASSDPSAIWVRNEADGAVREVDVTGRVLSGPVLPPGFAQFALAAGLVVATQDKPGWEVWDPANGQIRCRTITPNSEPFLLAAHGDFLVWASSSGPGALHLTAISTCADRALDDTAFVVGPDYPSQASFSPDGRKLAIAAAGSISGGGYRSPLQLIDLSSQRVTNVPVDIQGVPISAIAWTADGSRLFWLMSGLFTNSALVETWRVGDPAVHPLRAVDLTSVGPPLFVVPSG